MAENRIWKTKNERIRKRDDKLLKREKSIRSTRKELLTLTVVLVVSEFLIRNNYQEHTDLLYEMKMGVIAAFIALCVYYQALCRHVDSIKLYRQDISSQDDE